MSSELLRQQPIDPVAPVFWRVVNGPHEGHVARISVAEQLDRKFQEGRQHGLAEAVAIARQEADAQLQPVLQRLAQSISTLADARQRVRDETAADLVRLSIEIASRILHREITLDPDAIHGLLKAAFQKAQSREITRVLVHPAHEASVRSYLEQNATQQMVEIVADPRLDCGGILLETSQGQLDASIDTQLWEIERGLADRMHD